MLEQSKHWIEDLAVAVVIAPAALRRILKITEHTRDLRTLGCVLLFPE